MNLQILRQIFEIIFILQDQLLRQLFAEINYFCPMLSVAKSDAYQVRQLGCLKQVCLH